MRERVRETLLALLKLNTPSGHEGPVADFVDGELCGMGFDTRRDRAGDAAGSETGNVIGRLEGTAPGAEPLMLNAHMDTVAPTEGLVIREEDGVLRSSGDTILGADDKAGITAILEGVRAALAEGFPHPTLEIVFTVCEENGLRGAKHLDYAGLSARRAYAFDSGKPAGGIVVAAPSQKNLTVTVHGIAAHAGGAPEKGVSAIRIAADAICRMPLGRIDEETTANIGVIHGGQATNIIPDRVECRGEARSRNEEKLARQVRAMIDAFEGAARDAGGSVDVVETHRYSAFSLPHDHPLVLQAIEAGRYAGIAEPFVRAGGGGSDANIFNARGIEACVIGLGYDNVHAVSECVAIDDVAQAAGVVRELIRLGAS